MPRKAFKTSQSMLAETWLQELINESIELGQEEIDIGFGGIKMRLTVNMKPRHRLDHRIEVIAQPKPWPEQ